MPSRLRLRLRLLPTICLLSGLFPSAHAGFFSTPPTTTTSSAVTVVLRMDLNGYSNYGQADAADVAYTGDSHAWSFSLPAGMVASDFSQAFFRTALILDDHAAVDPALYSLQISTNNAMVFSGNPALPHGGPFNSVFNNWQVRDYPVALGAALPQQPVTFGLRNTSTAGSTDWIALDWLELHLVASAVPEPQTGLLLLLGMLGVTGAALRRPVGGE